MTALGSVFGSPLERLRSRKEPDLVDHELHLRVANEGRKGTGYKQLGLVSHHINNVHRRKEPALVDHELHFRVANEGHKGTAYKQLGSVNHRVINVHQFYLTIDYTVKTQVGVANGSQPVAACKRHTLHLRTVVTAVCEALSVGCLWPNVPSQVPPSCTPIFQKASHARGPVPHPTAGVKLPRCRSLDTDPMDVDVANQSKTRTKAATRASRFLKSATKDGAKATPLP